MNRESTNRPGEAIHDFVSGQHPDPATTNLSLAPLRLVERQPEDFLLRGLIEALEKVSSERGSRS